MWLPSEDPIIIHRLNFHWRLRKVLTFLEEHRSSRVSLGDAASVACMEKSAFSKFFSRAVGIQFHQFVLAWRVQQAKSLMIRSDMSLTEIAYEVGFQRLETFERAFRKFCGCVPSRYRLELLQSHKLLV